MERNNNLQTEKIAMKVSRVSIIVNVVLSVLKLLAGIIASSEAMISDAIHSASDVFSTFVVIIGIKLSGKKADKEHPYGHERLECVAAILLSMILAATGLGIGWAGVSKIITSDYQDLQIPGTLALGAAVISIIIKEWMFWYTRSNAKKINCGALVADAWHHRSDALSSIGSFIGILGARLGFPVMDPLASVIICIFILKAAFDIFKDAVDKMIDKSCDEDTINSIRSLVSKQEGVRRIDRLNTRAFGSKIYVDLEIAADGQLSLNQSHKIAEHVHDVIENTFPNVKHIMIHVNPYIDRKEIHALVDSIDKKHLEEARLFLERLKSYSNSGTT